MMNVLWFILSLFFMLVWTIAALSALPERPAFNVKIWRPKNPTVAILAVIVGAIGLYVRYLFPNPNVIDNWLLSLLVDIAPEMVGIAFTVVVIDELNQIRIEQNEKAMLIAQLGSFDNSFANEAARILRAYGWLQDGTLRQSNLVHANLSEVWLSDADLGGANLREAKLEAARLRRVNLSGANLTGVNMRSARLANANLTAAVLSDVNLDGATYSQDTRWPTGFNPKAAGAIEVRWDDELRHWIPVKHN